MYMNYRLAQIINEEARQRAERQRLINLQRGESRFAKALQNLFSKSQTAKREKYGLQ
jgi:hypothetical protein